MRYCGREFCDEEVTWIRRHISQNSDISRRKLSEHFCEQFGWRKPNGELKAMSCRVVLVRMERDGVVTLPPPKMRFVGCKVHQRRTLFAEPKPLLTISVGNISIDIEVVTKKSSALWNEFIDRYHYLGYTPLPGAQIRYFVLADGEIVSLLGFSAAAWKTAPRDEYIGWSHQARKKNLHLVVNNARFLVLPWVNSRNLCSKVFAFIRRRIADDFESVYNYRPVLLETFVEKDRFSGTCYKASNWLYVGDTTGRGKLNRTNKQEKPIKAVWVYPLIRSFRKVLCS